MGDWIVIHKHGDFLIREYGLANSFIVNWPALPQSPSVARRTPAEDARQFHS